jgi:hypothetical protein
MFSAAVLLCAIVASCSGGETPFSPSPPPPPPPVGGDVLLAAGDIGECLLPGAEQTARLLDGLRGTILALGDIAYPRGSHLDFGRCYHPHWGRHLDRTMPVPGNHEYETPGAEGYFTYFGDNAGPPGLGYYRFSRPGWLIVALNSEISMAEGSPQLAWLRAELAASRTACTLAFWHRPLFSSGPNGNNPDTRPLFRALYDAGADVVLSGHDHSYERFAPQDPDGRPDQARGIRQFVVGTGGARLSPIGVSRPNSEARGSEWGVLRLTLHATTFEWEFIPIAGGAYRDSGTGQCH